MRVCTALPLLLQRSHYFARVSLTHTRVRSRECCSRSRKTPKFNFNTKREIVVGEFSFKSSPQQPLNCGIRSSDVVPECRGTVFSSKLPRSCFLFYAQFFLPILIVLWCWVQSGSKPRRHTNYGGHERTDDGSLGFGLCCCWHWPNGRLGPASQSAYGWLSV